MKSRLAIILLIALGTGPGALRAAAEAPAAGAPSAPSAPSTPKSKTELEPSAAIPVGSAFFPVSEVRPGMEGIARTVFEGDRVEEFKVEILGVLKNAIGPQQDMILARLHGEKVEFTGVVSGMSGSPVYIDGRLLGAVSYRIGAFAKEPIAGITPISDMVRVSTTKVGSPSRTASRSVDRSAWAAAVARLGTGLPPESPGGETLQRVAAASGMQPIGTPLVCSGCDAEALREYAPMFESMGLTPTAGGGAFAAAPGAGLAPPAMPLLPGTAIGAALATGDINLAGIGTLTHVDGKRIFAFGHPMLGIGQTRVPMTQAQVLLTFASSAASFKIANATEPIGTIVEDRLTAIVGEVGQAPPMLPLTVRVAAGTERRDFHYSVVRDRSWAPLVVGLTTANSLLRTTEFDAADTLSLKYRIDLEGYPEVRYEELYSGTSPQQPVHSLVANDTAGLLNLLYNNPFEEPTVRSAEADIELLKASQVAGLTSLNASRGEVRPGEPFEVSAVLTSFRGPDRTVRFEVVLPEDTPPGDIQVIVGGGSFLDAIDRRLQERQLAQAADLKDVIRIIGRQHKSGTLYLRVARRSPSAVVRSELLPELPLSVFNVLNNPRLSADSTLLLEAPILEQSRDLDVVASGARRISLKVR